MTGEEEAMIREYLSRHGEVEDSESESYYKNTLHLAQVWKRRFEEGLNAAPN